MEDLKNELMKGKYDSLVDTLGNLSTKEMQKLGFSDISVPVWQQQKIIESPHWTLDTLAKIKMSYILGLNHQQVANLTQISSKTLMRWRKKSQALCLLIEHWKDQMEIIAKLNFLRLVTQGDHKAMMHAIQRHDPRYQSGYQKRCVDCKKLIISEHDRTEKMRNSFLYGWIKNKKSK